MLCINIIWWGLGGYWLWREVIKTTPTNEKTPTRHENLSWRLSGCMLSWGIFTPCRAQNFMSIFRLNLYNWNYTGPGSIDITTRYLCRCQDPFYWHGLSVIPAWISNYIHYTVWKWISYFIPHLTGDGNCLIAIAASNMVVYDEINFRRIAFTCLARYNWNFSEVLYWLF